MSRFEPGAKNPRATITQNQVDHFRGLIAEGWSTRRAAEDAGITYSQGRHIRFGGRWEPRGTRCGGS